MFFRSALCESFIDFLPGGFDCDWTWCQ